MRRDVLKVSYSMCRIRMEVGLLLSGMIGMVLG
jgi:hypothetical protein